MTLEVQLISVIAPCFNERGHVAAFCDAVAHQVLPPGLSMEVLIADGMSDDGSRELLKEMCIRDARFSLVDNPGRIVSCGLNRCLGQARGEVILRMDLHSQYACNYIAQCVAALRETQADNVGGPWRAAADADKPTQRAIAAAFQSRWLAGGARSRQLDFSGWVDTVYLGCWPRQSFVRFGTFDENLVRNQDDEHNLRIRLGGGRIWQSKDIHSSYRPRETVTTLFRQYLQYGYWKPFVARKHGHLAAWRHLLPALVLLAVPIAGFAALLGASVWPLWLLLGGYGIGVLLSALLIAAGSSWRCLWRLPGVIGAYHVAYGLGSLLGWLDVLRGVRTGRRGFARITR
jgi:glycosyltransferase involved in cell wall biosynthesis